MTAPGPYATQLGSIGAGIDSTISTLDAENANLTTELSAANAQIATLQTELAARYSLGDRGHGVAVETVAGEGVEAPGGSAMTLEWTDDDDEPVGGRTDLDEEDDDEEYVYEVWNEDTGRWELDEDEDDDADNDDESGDLPE